MRGKSKLVIGLIGFLAVGLLTVGPIVNSAKAAEYSCPELHDLNPQCADWMSGCLADEISLDSQNCQFICKTGPIQVTKSCKYPGT
jgi:hypothetical protein